MTSNLEYIHIRNGRLFDPSQGLDQVGDIVLGEGKIIWFGQSGQHSRDFGKLNGKSIVFDASGLTVTPGFIDLHCHLREPGFEEKETISSGTRAAAKGGFTTLCCMPNTRPAIDSAAVVEYIYKKAAEVSPIRVLPIGCISKGRLGEHLCEMGELYEAGVVGFSDDGNPVTNSSLMLHAMEYSTSFGLPVIDHCEDLSLSSGGVMNEGKVSALMGLKGIPVAAEEIMISRDIALASFCGARLHIAHISTEGSLELVKTAKSRGLPVTCEVTPHHLSLTEDFVKGYNTNSKVNPPLRTSADIKALGNGLENGYIDAIATDHAPHTVEDKLCEFDSALFGISNLETAFSSLVTLTKELSLKTIVYRLTAGPAGILHPSKEPSRNSLIIPKDIGTLKTGAPADVTVLDLDSMWKVEISQLFSKGRNTPLAGMTLRGRIMATFAANKIAYMAQKERLAGITDKQR